MPNQLYLPDWTVAEAVIDSEAAYQIAATYDVPPEACLKCGVVGALYKHGTKLITYVDAPVHGRQTFINVRRGRYRCRDCGGTFMQPLPDMDDDRRMTIRCRHYIEAQCLLKPNTHVAEDVGVDEKIVRQIGRAQADRLFERHEAGIRAPRILGIDELGLGGTMRAVFVDIETSWPIELLPTRWEKPVLNFLMNLPGRDETEIVTMDMWKPYRKAVRYAMPQAVIIVDKWHVQRLANDAMEMARRVYQGGLGISKETRKALKKGRSIFLKRPYTLSPKQLLDLDGWLKNTPELAGAYEIKEAFMEIWKARTAEDAKLRLDAWRESVPQHLLRLFKPVFTATRNWEPEIMNYFRHGGRRTNAATEARNRVIKMTNRLGAGYSFDMIRARSLFGKRPGRVRAEAAARRANMIECFSCKALFEPALLNAKHLKPVKDLAVGERVQGVSMCAECHRFHTDGWFNHGRRSTSKSE